MVNLFIQMEKYYILTFMLFFGIQGFSQSMDSETDTDSIKLLQLSGVTTMSEDGEILPFVHVYNQTQKMHTASTIQGVYSMVVKPGDTISYTFVGFSPSKFVVPTNPKSRFLNHTQLLSIDTFYLPEALVRPLPGKERFQYEFVYKDITDDQLELARQNTEYSQLLFIANVLLKDAGENAAAAQKDYIDGFKTYNQTQEWDIGSPAAWMKFIESLKK